MHITNDDTFNPTEYYIITETPSTLISSLFHTMKEGNYACFQIEWDFPETISKMMRQQETSI